MLALIPILLLLLAPILMSGIHLARRAFPYHWLVAVSCALLAWPFMLLSGLRLPLAIPLLQWDRQPLFGVSPALRVDSLSWPFALALATLVLAVLLTAVARARQGNWMYWAGSCSLAALGLVAVQAGNPLTLLLAWTAIDLAELLILLVQVYESDAREQIVVAFSARVGGSMLLIWAGVAARFAGTSLDFASLPPSASLFLLLAAGLRLGVLPLNIPYLRELPLRRGLGVSIRLVPAASSLILLARVAAAGVPPAFSSILLGLAGLAALYAAISWATEKDELSARPFWILGMASFAIAAAVRVQPAAALSWGLACLLPGSLLFLANARHRFLLPLAALGLLGFAGLPLTPGWSGTEIYLPSPVAQENFLLPLFLFAQVLFLAGYARYALRPGEPLAGAERWVWVIYPLGLALLPFVHFLLGWRFVTGQPGFAPTRLLAGLASLGLGGLAWMLGKRSRITPALTAAWQRVFSLAWLYRFLWSIYQAARRILDGITLLLEGEAGILWALLILALILSMLAPGGPGG